jgi:hypothetical protein
MVKKEKREMKGKCMACGNVSKLDDKHKFSSHIINFPPKYDKNQMDPNRVRDDGGKPKKEEETKKKGGLDKETKEKMSNIFYI